MIALNVVLPVLVNVLEGEAAGRLTVAAAKIAVDPVQHRDLIRIDLFRFGAGGGHFADMYGSRLERLIEHPVHHRRVLTLGGFGHGVLRNNAVFCDEVLEHIPLAAVMDAGFENVRNHAVIGRERSRLDDGFEEEVGTLELVPEGGIALRELKVGEVFLLCDLFTQEVQRSKQPAAAGFFLICGRKGRDLDRELVAHLRSACADVSDVAHLGLGKSRRCELADRVGAIMCGEVLQLFCGDRCGLSHIDASFPVVN